MWKEKLGKFHTDTQSRINSWAREQNWYSKNSGIFYHLKFAIVIFGIFVQFSSANFLCSWGKVLERIFCLGASVVGLFFPIDFFHFLLLFWTPLEKRSLQNVFDNPTLRDTAHAHHSMYSRSNKHNVAEFIWKNPWKFLLNCETSVNSISNHFAININVMCWRQFPPNSFKIFVIGQNDYMCIHLLQISVFWQRKKHILGCIIIENRYISLRNDAPLLSFLFDVWFEHALIFWETWIKTKIKWLWLDLLRSFTSKTHMCRCSQKKTRFYIMFGMLMTQFYNWVSECVAVRVRMGIKFFSINFQNE